MVSSIFFITCHPWVLGTRLKVTSKKKSPRLTLSRTTRRIPRKFAGHRSPSKLFQPIAKPAAGFPTNHRNSKRALLTNHIRVSEFVSPITEAAASISTNQQTPCLPPPLAILLNFNFNIATAIPYLAHRPRPKRRVRVVSTILLARRIQHRRNTTSRESLASYLASAQHPAARQPFPPPHPREIIPQQHANPTAEDWHSTVARAVSTVGLRYHNIPQIPKLSSLP